VICACAETLTLDVLRIVLLLEGGFVLGLTVFVLRLYLYARRLMSKSGESHQGAQPYHVYMIASSHALLVFTQMGVLIGRFGDEAAWYGTPVAIVAFTLSIVALINILHLENSRIHRMIERVHPEMHTVGNVR
jgi:amino acid transporter